VTEISRRAFTAGLVGVAAGAAMPAARSAANVATPVGDARPKLPVRTDVLVLGAGVSGLGAALVLEESGASVRVLEGRRRVGGRVYTRMDLPGAPEMGFNAMYPGYGRGLAMAKQVGVELYDSAPRLMRPPPDIWLRGRRITLAEWPTAPENVLPEKWRKAPPWTVANAVARSSNPLAGPEAWVAPEAARHDGSLYDVLRAAGLDDASIRLAFDTNAGYGTSAHDVSALMYYYVEAWGRAQMQGGQHQWVVRGGNQRLPQAMAARLKGDVVLGTEVVAIETTGDGVTAHCRDGRRYEAKRIVCSLPASVLRTIRFLPGLPERQYRAVMLVPYMINSLAVLVPTRRYWEADGGSPSMWTDGIAGVVAAQRLGTDPDEITCFLANPRGSTAAQVDRLGAEGAQRAIVAEIERLRPSARGALKAVAFHSWAQDPYAGGDWAVFAPGQAAAYATAFAEPHGAVHFCGEHTATGNRGLEGALESGERAAIEVLGAL
jgi:monoamine oxidase